MNKKEEKQTNNQISFSCETFLYFFILFICICIHHKVNYNILINFNLKCKTLNTIDKWKRFYFAMNCIDNDSSTKLWMRSVVYPLFEILMLMHTNLIKF